MSRVRNCVELAKNADINHYYCMSINDTYALFDAYSDDPAKLIYECFKYGYVQGVKAQKAKQKQGGKK